MTIRFAPALASTTLALLAACGGSGGGSTAGSGTLQVVLFETRSEIAAGIPDVADAVLVDLNGDGHADLAVTGLQGALQILFGDGRGGYQPAQNVALPGKPSDVRAGDLDNDGDTDLVVLRSPARLVTVLRNDGAGRFQIAANLGLAPNSTALAVGDCDGDNRLDVLVAHQSTSELTLFPGRGDASFAAPRAVSMPPGSEPFGMTLADVNGDGFRDLVVTDRKNDRVVILPARPGGGHGAMTTHAVGKEPIAVSVGDVTRDGRADIVVSAFGDQLLTVLVNQGSSFSRADVRIDGPPGNTLVGDVTGDGIDDLVVCVFLRATVSLFPGLANGQLGPEIQMSATGLPYRPLVGDVNEDGEPDLVVTGSGLDKISLFLGKGGALSGSINYEAGIAAPEFVTATDLNGDGKAEILTAGRGDSRISLLGLFENAARNTRDVRPVGSVDLGRSIFNLVRGDLNGDGLEDVAVACEGGIKIVANASNSRNVVLDVVPRDPGQVLAPGIGPFDVAIADMNGDGIQDLVIGDAYADRVSVLLARGAQFAYRALTLDTPVEGMPGGLAVADFTGDRVPDVAVARNSASRIDILRNDGAGSLTKAIEIPVLANPTWLRTADFNHDGRADLVVSNSGVDRVTVLISQGLAFTAVPMAAGESPTALMARDLNRDGHPDILVASLRGADFRVLLGDGKGGFPTQTPFPGTFKATAGDLADLNADGLLDLVIASADTTRISVYRNISR